MKIENHQIELFMQLLRGNLVDSGIEGSEFDKAYETAARQLLAPPSDPPVFSRETSPKTASENRGIDSLGRILVEFCFFRAHEVPMIWPDNSDLDQTARKVFTQECIPRPLMRYFLASIRGSIANLDNFEASSILSGNSKSAHEQRKAQVDELLEEFKGPFGDGESAIEWNAVYNDPRFKGIALDLIRTIRRKIEEFGLERYLRIIQNFHQMDPDNTGINTMQRPFTIEDAKQIDEALWAAEEALALIVD